MLLLAKPFEDGEADAMSCVCQSCLCLVYMCVALLKLHDHLQKRIDSTALYAVMAIT